MKPHTPAAARVTALLVAALVTLTLSLTAAAPVAAQERTAKPPLHGRHWMAITGKPLGATAGAKMFERGG
ncbi:MAG: gamma-glutamyltransferase family protein, partial [Gammaproteobacteria bacterium]